MDDHDERDNVDRLKRLLQLRGRDVVILVSKQQPPPYDPAANAVTMRLPVDPNRANE